MQKITLHLPKYRLHMQFRLAKRRRSALDEPIIPTKKRLNLKYHVGGLTRKFFRYIFEHKSAKKLLGVNMAFMLVASSFVPTLASNEFENSANIAIYPETPITTTLSVSKPVENSVKITQGYNFFHPGLDLDGETGDKIFSIKSGTVESVQLDKYGYGKHVLISHGNGITSLYAHLSKIDVKVGETIVAGSKIGEMGSTGHSTGSHLHFEVRQNGLPINPLSVLPK